MDRHSFSARLLLAGLALTAPLFWSIGIHYGLPTARRSLSIDTDEFTWMEGLSRMRPSRLDFNPRSLNQPHAYFYTYGSALAAAAALKVVTISRDKKFYFQHIKEWARLYLIGRWLQVIFAWLCLLVLYQIGRELEDEWAGLLAAVFFAVAPGTLGTAHFNQSNLSVTLWSLLFLWGAIRYVRGKSRGSLIWAALAAGFSFSMKYSAAPCLVTLAYAHRLKEGSWAGAVSRRAWTTYFAAVAAFCFGTPYLILDPRGYFGNFFGYFARAGLGTPFLDPLWFRPFLPFAWPLPQTVGLGLTFIGILGLVEMARRPAAGERLVVFWAAVFYLFLVKVGRVALPGRCLIAAPALCLGAALWARRHWGNPWSKAAVVAVFANAAALSLVLAGHYASGPLVQETAATWLEMAIPGASIAVPRDPYWYSPDNVIRSMTHPETLSRPFKIISVDYDYDLLLKENPPYLLMAESERTSFLPSLYPRSKDFVRRLETGKRYRLLKTFPLQLRLGPFPVFVQRPWAFSDILWTQPLYLYARSDIYVRESGRLRRSL